jgi:predicted RNA-binding protein associated with RNAse of E/G family
MNSIPEQAEDSRPYGLDAFLDTFLLPEVEAILKDGSISALNAAHQINELNSAKRVGLSTSKTSVRRYRATHGIAAEARNPAAPPAPPRPVGSYRERATWIPGIWSTDSIRRRHRDQPGRGR